MANLGRQEKKKSVNSKIRQLKLSPEDHNEKIIQKNEQILRDQLDTTKHTNICMRIPEGKKEASNNNK